MGHWFLFSNNQHQDEICNNTLSDLYYTTVFNFSYQKKSDVQRDGGQQKFPTPEDNPVLEGNSIVEMKKRQQAARDGGHPKFKPSQDYNPTCCECSEDSFLPREGSHAYKG